MQKANTPNNPGRAFQKDTKNRQTEPGISI